MEKLVAHVRANPYIYGTVVLVVIAVIAVMNITTYETLILRNFFKKILFGKYEGFQNQQVIAAGTSVAYKQTQENCQKMKEQIDVYEKLKITHKDVHIENLDENLKILKEFFVSYNCE